MAAGYITKKTGGNYMPLFIAACVVYFSAIVLIHAFSPKLERAKLD